MKSFLYVLMLLAFNDKVWSSQDPAILRTWIEETKAPVLLSRSTANLGENKEGGVFRPDTAVAFADHESFTQLMKKHFPRSSTLLDKKIDTHVITLTDTFIDYLSLDASTTHYGVQDAKFYKKTPGETKTPVFVTFGIYDCVNVIVDASSCCAAMHVNFCDYEEGESTQGRLGRLLDKVPTAERASAKVSLISGSYSKLTEHVMACLTLKQFTIHAAHIGNTILSREEIMKLVSLKDLQEGTTLDELRTLEHYQDIRYGPELYNIPAICIYDVGKAQHISVKTPTFYKARLTQKLIELLIFGDKQDKEFQEARIFLRSHFTILERNPETMSAEGKMHYAHALEIYAKNIKKWLIVAHNMYGFIGLSWQEDLKKIVAKAQLVNTFN